MLCTASLPPPSCRLDRSPEKGWLQVIMDVMSLAVRVAENSGPPHKLTGFQRGGQTLWPFGRGAGNLSERFPTFFARFLSKKAVPARHERDSTIKTCLKHTSSRCLKMERPFSNNIAGRKRPCVFLPHRHKLHRTTRPSRGFTYTRRDSCNRKNPFHHISKLRKKSMLILASLISTSAVGSFSTIISTPCASAHSTMARMGTSPCPSGVPCSIVPSFR